MVNKYVKEPDMIFLVEKQVPVKQGLRPYNF